MTASREARRPARSTAAPSSRRARPLCVGAGVLVGAACASSPARPVSAPVAASVALAVSREGPPAVTMLAPVGVGAPAAASVVPSAGGAGVSPELVPPHRVVATALEPTLAWSQRGLFSDGRPVGEVLGAVLREGQAVEQVMTVAAGCYAVVGLSPSLSLLGLEVASEPGALLSARSSQGVVSLGTPGCLPLAAGPLRVRLSALGGAGPAVARLYAR